MSGSGQRVLKHLTEVQSCSARCNTHPNSVIAELETADSPDEYASLALMASGLVFQAT